MEPSVLATRPRPGILLITLNRPEVRNALNGDMVSALAAVLDSALRDEGVRALVLTGSGSAFCAGADLESLRALRSATPQENAEDCARLKALYRAFATCPLPVVAAVNGPALAGGCGLASLADVLVACPEATFGYPEARIGFVAAMVLVFLSRQLGERLAREWLLTARTVDAEEARRCGLVRRLAPAGDLLEAALDEAEAMARCAPDSAAMTKELLWRTSGLPVERALDLAASANVFARTSPDMKEGLAAFFEKRKPRW